MKKNMSISLGRLPGVGRTPLFALSLAAALCVSPLSRGQVPAPSTDVVVVAVSGTTYNISGSSAGIVCVGTSTITVYPGTTLGGLQAGLQSQDGSVQDWIVMDSGSNILTVPTTVLVSGDTLTVVAADGTDQYVYGIAAFNNPTEQGMPGGINPVTGWQEGNYWNEALYFQIDSTVNANRPNFPNYTVTITDPKYAGLITQITEGSGTTAKAGVYYYGAAINQAIIDCNAAGGGKVVIPVGGSLNTATMTNAQGVASLPNSLYYSGSINLLSNVNLYIAPGVHIAFVRNATNVYYPCMPGTYQGQMWYNYASPIYALNQNNIALTGGGTTSCLDMQCHVSSSWTLPTRASGATAGSNNTLNDQDYELIPLTGRINTDTGTVPALVPLAVGGWGSGQGYTMVPPPAGTGMGSGLTNVHSVWQSPEMMEIMFCKNLYVSGVEDYSPMFWNTHPFECTNVLFQNMSSYDTIHATDDGLDPESCTNVVLENCAMTAQDDCLAMKAGRNVECRWPMGDGFGGTIVRHSCQDVIIRNGTFNDVSGDQSAISAGSENAAGVFNVFVENCTAGGSIDNLFHIKTTVYRNNVIAANFYIRNSTAPNYITELQTNYPESVTYPHADVCNCTLRDIYFENVNTVSTDKTTTPPFYVPGGDQQCPMTNINYRNSTYHCSGSNNTYQSAFKSVQFLANLNASNISMVNSTTGKTTVVNTTPINLLGVPTITVSNSVVTLAADAEYNSGVPADDSSDVWTGPYTFTRNEPVNQVLAPKTLVISGQLDLSTYPLFATPTASGGAGGVVSIYVDRTSAPVACTLSPTGAFTSGNITITDSPEPYWYMGYHTIDVNMYDSSYLNINSYVYNVAYQSGALTQTVKASPGTLTVAAGNTQLVNAVVNASEFLTGGAPVSTIVSVTGNQGTLPASNYVINPSGTNPLQVTLTAQAGLIYTLTIQTTDSFGNSTTSTVEVIGYSPLPSRR